MQRECPMNGPILPDRITVAVRCGKTCGPSFFAHCCLAFLGALLPPERAAESQHESDFMPVLTISPRNNMRSHEPWKQPRKRKK